MPIYSGEMLQKFQIEEIINKMREYYDSDGMPIKFTSQDAISAIWNLVEMDRRYLFLELDNIHRTLRDLQKGA